MSRAATSILVFGIYLAISGPALMIAPNALLETVGVPRTDEIWIRMLGLVLFLLAFYYMLAARAELTALFRWSTWVRGAVLPFVACFTWVGLVQPIILWIGIVDLSGAVWTALALRHPKPVEPAQRRVA